MRNTYIVILLLFSCLIQAQKSYNTYFKQSEQNKNLGYRFSVTANDKNGKQLTPINTNYNDYDIIYFRNENINNNITYKIKVIQGINDYNIYINTFTLEVEHEKKQNEPLNEFFEVVGNFVRKSSGSIFLSGISLQTIDLINIDCEKYLD